ncbi:MAG: (2Fe-2S)-binding protein [Actinomycetia bacterium]|nr:(2Fe-2S)-binding protein [Actinomycetes bacterium]
MLGRLLELNERHAIEHVGGPAAVDTDRYVSTERHERELDRMFRRGAQLVGFSADLPEPATHLPLRVGDVPVLLVRDDDGAVRAFVNACRHRGSPVCETAGSGRRLTCPYHAWTYDLGGALVGVPDRTAFEGCIEGEALRPLPVDERHGLIVVDPDPVGAADVDDYLGAMAPELAHLGFDRLVAVEVREVELAMNWKLGADAAMEAYHAPYLHKATVGPMTQVGYAYDGYGRHHRMGLLGVTEHPLTADEHDPMRILEGVTLVHHLYPTSMVVVGAGVVAHQRCEPGATPDTCTLRLATYAWGGPVTEKHRYLSELLWRVVIEEDCRVQQAAQRAFSSGALDRVLFGANEPGLHGMHASWDAALL